MSAWLTTGDVALRLKISAVYVRQLADEGKLQSVRTASGYRLFKIEDVEKMAAEREMRPQVRRAVRGCKE